MHGDLLILLLQMTEVTSELQFSVTQIEISPRNRPNFLLITGQQFQVKKADSY